MTGVTLCAHRKVQDHGTPPSRSRSEQPLGAADVGGTRTPDVGRENPRSDTVPWVTPCSQTSTHKTPLATTPFPSAEVPVYPKKWELFPPHHNRGCNRPCHQLLACRAASTAAEDEATPRLQIRRENRARLQTKFLCKPTSLEQKQRELIKGEEKQKLCSKVEA